MNNALVSWFVCLVLLTGFSREIVAVNRVETGGRRGDQRPIGIDTSFGDRCRDAGLALQSRRLEETIAKTTSALAMRPDGKNAGFLHRWRGVAYESLGDFTRAFADYSEAIRRDPAVDHAYEYRASLHQRRGDFSDAIADLTQALRNESDTAGIYSSRGSIYLETGRPDLARLDYERVINTPAKEGWQYAYRAKAYSVLGQYKAAASDLATAKRMMPSDDFVLNLSAWFEATCPDAAFRNGRAAVRDATRACKRTKWKYPSCIDTLAAAYAETGDFDRAIGAAKQAISQAGALPNNKRKLQEHLRLFQQGEPVRAELKIKMNRT